MSLRLTRLAIQKKPIDRKITLIRNYHNERASQFNTTSVLSNSKSRSYCNKKAHQTLSFSLPASPFKWPQIDGSHKKFVRSFSKNLWQTLLHPKHKYVHYNFRLLSSYYALYMIALYGPLLSRNNTHFSQCESNTHYSKNESSLVLDTIDKRIDKEKTKKKWKRVLLVIKRVVQLLLTFAPVALLYPVHRLISSSSSHLDNNESIGLITADSKSSDWYLKLCLKCVESSGAAIIKLMQVILFLNLVGHAIRCFCLVF